MENLSFEIDKTATILALLGGLFFLFIHYWNKPNSAPFFLFSKNEIFKTYKGNKTKLIGIPNKLYTLAFILFSLAFIDPHFSQVLDRSISQKATPTEGTALYLILDKSGSMAESVIAKDKNNLRKSIPKIQLLKQLSSEFINSRPSDLIGIIAFARYPTVLSPLTLDKENLQKKLSEIKLAANQEEDGTGIGYAIYKTAHLIGETRHFAETLSEDKKPAYQINNAVMIVLTDGFQDPNYLDQGNRLRTIELDEAAEYAKKENIKLYVINIDPIINSDQFAPHRRQLERITALTGGKFFAVNNSQDLAEILSIVDGLEKSKIPIDIGIKNASVEPQRVFSLYPFLIAIGMFFIFIALLLDTTILKRGP